MTSKRNNMLFLNDIRQNIRRIEVFTQNDKDAYMKSELIQFAVLKCIENIGEAVKNLDSSFKTELPDTDWRIIAKTRDFLAHHYFSVDPEMIWGIVANDIPLLKKSLASIRKAEQNDSQEQTPGLGM